MLRDGLLVLACVFAVAGAVLCVMHIPAPGLHLVVWGILMLVAVLFERWRYHGLAASPPSGWEKTGERFEDPETGRVMDVMFHPASGARRYVDSADSTPSSPR